MQRGYKCVLLIVLAIFLLNICMEIVLAPKDFIAKTRTDDHLLIDAIAAEPEEFYRQEEIQKVAETQLLESDFD